MLQHKNGLIRSVAGREARRADLDVGILPYGAKCFTYSIAVPHALLSMPLGITSPEMPS